MPGDVPPHGRPSARHGVTADRFASWPPWSPATPSPSSTRAGKVARVSSDIPGGPGGNAPRPLTKGENGVWEVTLDPVAPGTYRYLLDVDGVRAVDPRNTAVSESNGNVWSLVRVPGASFMDT